MWECDVRGRRGLEWGEGVRGSVWECDVGCEVGDVIVWGGV